MIYDLYVQVLPIAMISMPMRRVLKLNYRYKEILHVDVITNCTDH